MATSIRALSLQLFGVDPRAHERLGVEPARRVPRPEGLFAIGRDRLEEARPVQASTSTPTQSAVSVREARRGRFPCCREIQGRSVAFGLPGCKCLARTRWPHVRLNAKVGPSRSPCCPYPDTLS